MYRVIVRNNIEEFDCFKEAKEFANKTGGILYTRVVRCIYNNNV